MAQPTSRKPSDTHAQPAGFPARRAALRLLDAVLRRGLPLEQALGSATKDIPLPADRALAHWITALVLRHMADLDALIDSATRQRLPDDSKARMVLRLALAQALLLETPHHAVVATALPLVDGGPRKLVHGVLSALLKRGGKLPAVAQLPDAVELRWGAQWGEEVVEAARGLIAQRPPLDLSLRDAAATADWVAQLGGISLAPGHVRLPAESAVTELPGFGTGDWWVQDLAASLPARLLGQGKGGRALDLCAAPGGKTMQLVSAGWDAVSVDQSERRTERLRANLERTGLSATVVSANLLDWTPDRAADAILLDAPCSATGIFRRHPDVIHRVGPRQIAELAELQAKLLDRALDWLTPGGKLVYATCSLEPQEGEAQIEAMLARRSEVRLAEIDAAALPEGIVPSGTGTIRTLPGTLAAQGGLDGFFMALLTKD